MELGLDTLGVGYHSAPDAAPHAKKFNKVAQIQDFAYLIKGALLKQHYSPLHESYKKSTVCGQTIEVRPADGGVSLKYAYLCRQRWCPRCMRIRAAELMNTYVPIVEQWSDLYLVTLTVPNVQPLQLKDKLTEMQQRFRNVMRTIHRRLKTNDVKAIKSIEVSQNMATKTLHPHYHILCERKDAALLIRELWMERSVKDGDSVVWSAQDVRRASSPGGAAKELFKYLTKFLAKADGKMTFDGWLLDKVYVGLYRKHLVQTYGFEKPDDDEDPDEELVALDDTDLKTYAVITWVNDAKQYIDMATGEVFGNYRRSRAFERISKTIEGSPPT